MLIGKKSALFASLFFLLSLLSLAGLCSAAALPQFIELAEKSGGAVVNISTVKMVTGSQNFKDLFKFKDEESPFEDYFDQFEKFFQNPKKPHKERSLGSGFIISEDGYIVTNNHVVADANEVKVNLKGHNKESESFEAKVVGRDKETDLALIKITAKQKLPFLQFGDSDALKVGEWVMAIGNPFGLEHTVTAGIVSAKGRVIGSGAFDDFIQTDASINPGNSGGPLLNLDGQVVGVNAAIVATGQGIGFAIPSNMAKKIVAQLKESKKVQRGWIGVTIQDVDAKAAKALGLDKPKGALISSVLEGQPAEKAGMQTSDVVQEINGAPVEDANDLLRRIAGIAPGEKANLSVWRKGKIVKITLTLGERDLDKLANKDESAPQTPDDKKNSAMGLVLKPVDKKQAQALGLDKPKGLLVSQVEDGSKAEENDVRVGDLILEANQQPVNSVKELKEVLDTDAKKKGVVMLLIRRDKQSVFRTVPVE
jgi:serine protease Do